MTLPIDPDRFLADLTALRRIEAVGTGLTRMAFSDTDIAARQWLARRMTEAGLTATADACGNLFGLPLGDAPWPAGLIAQRYPAAAGLAGRCLRRGLRAGTGARGAGLRGATDRRRVVSG
jgi:hypothetical protein